MDDGEQETSQDRFVLKASRQTQKQFGMTAVCGDNTLTSHAPTHSNITQRQGLRQ